MPRKPYQSAGTNTMHIYDVALSFAGEQREYVEAVAKTLRKSGIRIFYDRFEEDRLWGRELISELDRVYRKESRYVVVFISAAYRDKKWARHEFRSILASAFEKREEFVLPVRFDDTDLDGLHPTIAYFDASTVKPTKLAASILNKLPKAPIVPQHALNNELRIWRLVRSKYASEAFSGEAASFVGGHLNHKGSRAVYCASSLCIAILETVFHTELMHDFVAVGAKLYLSMPATVISPTDLPKNRMDNPESMQELGDQWLRSNISAALIIPSKVLPAERIILLNPLHPDYETLTIFSEESVDISGLRMV